MVIDMVEDNFVVGIVWGIIFDVIIYYVVFKDVKGVSVVQMNGLVNFVSLGIFYVGLILLRMVVVFGGEVIYFLVLIFFDSVLIKVVMW